MKKYYFVFLLIALVLALFFIRLIGHTEIDDVTPGIQCNEELIERSDVLWVIPMFENETISNKTEWCQQLKNTGKILGLHGVRHTYEEFNEERDQEYLQQGIDAFQTCFNRTPGIFKAPQLVFSESNRKLIEDNGMKISGKLNQLTHKVYHCSDTGLFPNWMIRIF